MHACTFRLHNCSSDRGDVDPVHTWMLQKNVIYWRAIDVLVACQRLPSLAEVVNCTLGGDGEEISVVGSGSFSASVCPRC